MGTRIYIYNKVKIQDSEKQILLRDTLRRYLSYKAKDLSTVSLTGQGAIQRETAIKDTLPDVKEFSMIDDFDLSTAEGSHGKPRFTDKKLRNIHFSISHSGKYWAIAFSESQVGLDIEDIAMRKFSHARSRKIAKRFFSPEEQQYYDGQKSEQDKRIAFYKIWTRKEAYLKYTGEGITRQLNEFCTLESGLAALQEIETSNVHIAIETLIESDALACSCCARKDVLQNPDENGEEIFEFL